MIFKTLHGSEKRVKNIKKFLIDWDESSRSKLQFNVKKFLKKYWQNHVVFEELTIPGTRLSLDFYNANKKIAIEVQGKQHTKYTPFFHGGYKNNFLSQLKRDQDKAKFCEINELTLVEIYDGDKLTKSLFKKYGVVL
tara:strand:+ start:19049 stop:19459 length:411 start_codon:yes stop_codon:yes gene_type:complete